MIWRKLAVREHHLLSVAKLSIAVTVEIFHKIVNFIHSCPIDFVVSQKVFDFP